MIGVAVLALMRRPVGTREEIALDVPCDELPELDLARDLEVRGVATNLGDEGVQVALQIEGSIARECARCLRPAQTTLKAEAEEIFRAGGDPPILDDHTIDIEPMVHEAMVLAEPMRLLCRPDCQGLCPTCGKDLNEGPCGCVEETGDPRLAPLARLLQSREEKR